MKKIFAVLCFCCLLELSGSESVSEISLFPADFQNGRFAVNEGRNSPMYLTMKGNGIELAQGNAVLEFTLPAWAEVSAVYPWHPQWRRLQKIKKDGTGKYIVELEKKFWSQFVMKKPPWANGLNVYFRVTEGSAGKSAPAVLRVTGAGKTYKSHTFLLQAAPALKAQEKMRYFSIFPTSFASEGAPDINLFKESVAYWKGLGEKSCYLLENISWSIPQEQKRLLAENFKLLYTLHCVQDTPLPYFSDDGFFDRTLSVSRPGVPRLENAVGKVIRGGICPQYLINDPEGIFWDKYIVESLRKLKEKFPGLHDWWLDYESLPENATCDNCRAVFAGKMKLKSIPSREDIRFGKPLHTAWRKFRADQRTEILGRLYRTIHKHFPGDRLILCTVILTPDWLSNWSALDVAAMEKYSDLLFNMHYSSGLNFYNGLRYNLDKLQKPQWVLCDPAEKIIQYFVRYTPERLRQNILVSAAMGVKAFSVFPADYYDAGYLTMFSETAGAIALTGKAYTGKAENERLKTEFLNTVRLRLPDGKEKKEFQFPDFSKIFRSFFHADGNDCYATLVNYSSIQPLFLKVSVPDFQGEGRVIDLLTRTEYSGVGAEQVRSGFLVKVPPDGSLLLKIGGGVKALQICSRENLEKELNSALAAAKRSAESYQEKKKKNCRISWQLNQNEIVVTLENCASSATVNPASGGIVTKWRVPGGGEMLNLRSKAKQLGHLQLYQSNPLVPEFIPFEVVHTEFAASQPRILMRYTVPADSDAGGEGNPLSHLTIERDISLDWQGDIRIRDTFINTSSHPMKFGYRLKNLPVYRWKPGPPRLLLENREIAAGDSVFLKKGTVISWFGAVNPRTLQQVRADLIWGKFKLRLDAPDFAGLYFWGDGKTQTMEALSPEIELAPGEKRSLEQKFLNLTEK